MRDSIANRSYLCICVSYKLDTEILHTICYSTMTLPLLFRGLAYSFSAWCVSLGEVGTEEFGMFEIVRPFPDFRLQRH